MPSWEKEKEKKNITKISKQDGLKVLKVFIDTYLFSTYIYA